MENQKEIFEMLADFTGTPVENISLNNHLKKDLGLDSLDVVELTMEMEDKFNILPNWEDEQIETVSELIDVIKSHMNFNLQYSNVSVSDDDY